MKVNYIAICMALLSFGVWEAPQQTPKTTLLPMEKTENGKTWAAMRKIGRAEFILSYENPANNPAPNELIQFFNKAGERTPYVNMGKFGADLINYTNKLSIDIKEKRIVFELSGIYDLISLWVEIPDATKDELTDFKRVVKACKPASENTSLPHYYSCTFTEGANFTPIIEKLKELRKTKQIQSGNTGR